MVFDNKMCMVRMEWLTLNSKRIRFVMNRRACFVLVLLVAASIAASPLAKGAEYVWPLAKRFGLSGTFGECRGTSLHAGVDLKTAQVTGLRVMAIESGVIYRLAVNYRGFGKALYIEHPNGLISVYGHLDSFEDKTLGLERIVEKQRKKTGERYPGNIFISVPVEKGQVIGYSGETGAGFPHLHFEIRRGEARPINPLSIFRQKDSTAPIISRLILTPLGPDALVNGEHGDAEIWIRRGSRDTKKTKEAPKVKGRFVVLVNAYDTVEAPNHCGVHRLELSVDGEVVYSTCHEEIEYGRSYRKAGLIYDHEYAYFRPASYVYRIHNRYGARRPDEGANRGGGILDFSDRPGTHTLAVKAWDDAGNMSSARAEVVSDPRMDAPSQPPSRALVPAGKDQKRALVCVYDDFFDIWYRLTARSGLVNAGVALPELKISARGGAASTIDPVGVGLDWVRFCFPTDRKFVGRLNLELEDPSYGTGTPSCFDEESIFVVPTQGGVLETEQLRIDFPADSLYADQVFALRQLEAREMRDIPVVYGVATRVLPEGIPLDKPVTVYFKCPSTLPGKDLSRCGVYEYNPKRRKWHYLDNSPADERMVSANVRYLSVFGLLIDKERPSISVLKPKGRGSLRKRRNELLVKIVDRGSGVDYRSIKVTIDGQEVDAEYDPDRKLLKGRFDLAKRSGKHVLKVRVKDIAGNESSATRKY